MEQFLPGKIRCRRGWRIEKRRDRRGSIMHVEDWTVGGVLVVKPVDPRIDASGSLSFKGRIVDWINQGHHFIVLDLSEVDFIDSSGLGTIVSILKTLGKGGELYISGLRETVASIFRLTRMDRVFRIYPSADIAARAMLEALCAAETPG